MEKTGFLPELVTGLLKVGCAVECISVSATGPTTDEVDKVAALARRHRTEAMVALGGGTVTDAAKAAAAAVGSSATSADLLRGRVAIVAALPLIAVPSTAGTGSDMNRSAILTDPSDLVRDGLRSDHLFPRHALVDPEISSTQPLELAARSAFDALSHAIESYVSPRAMQETDALAEQAMDLIVAAARALATGSTTPAQRADLALASTMMGVNLSCVGTCLPHRLDKAVCAVFPHIAHAQSVAFFFPGWIRNSWPGAIPKFARIARCLDPATLAISDEEAAASCGDLAAALLTSLGLGNKPAALGITSGDFQRILSRVAGDLSAYPVPVSAESMQQFLDETLRSANTPHTKNAQQS